MLPRFQCFHLYSCWPGICHLTGAVGPGAGDLLAPKRLRCCSSHHRALLHSFVVKGSFQWSESCVNSAFVWRLCLTSLPPFVPYFVAVTFELCLTLYLCVFSPVVLRVGLCLVWISEDRSRSASAPTLGTVILHVCPCQPCALTAANSWLWPHTCQTTARHQSSAAELLPIAKRSFHVTSALAKSHLCCSD